MKKLLNNKKGAEMAISTIIVIVLALVVLVVVVMGFSSGWSTLWERVTGFGGGKVNVQSVIQGCQLACSTNAEYDYCTKTSKLVFTTDKNDEVEIARNGKYNCMALQSENVGLTCDTAFSSSCEPKKVLDNAAAETCKVKASECTSLDVTSCDVAVGCETDTPTSSVCVAKANACDSIPEADCDTTVGCELA